MKVKAIDRENSMLEPKRISDVTTYILKHFETDGLYKTSRDFLDCALEDYNNMKENLKFFFKKC